MKYAIILTFLSVILQTSCTKKPLFELSGKVLLEGTNAPISGVELNFYSFIPSGEFGTPGSYNLISTVETNSNGEYSLTYNQSFQTISIAAFKEGFFECRHPNTCLPAFSQEGEFERNLFLQAEAHLVFELFDTDLLSNQNSIIIKPQFYDDVTKTILVKENTTISGISFPNEYHTYSYTILGLITIDSLLLRPFVNDTVIIEF